MDDSLAALVLAAGEGHRLRPLSALRPKALCPLGAGTLVDLALARVCDQVGETSVAVNVHHGRAQMEAHLGDRVHLSVEEPEALGTAGAVANLRPWLDGRGVLVVNADTWHEADLDPLVSPWDGARVRVLICGGASQAFGPTSRVVASLLPAAEVTRLVATPSGLWEVCWREGLARGAIDVVTTDAAFIDCATPADYLAANLSASGGESVIGAGAVVEGSVRRSVVWPGGVVRADEVLIDAVRVGERLTVRV